MTDKQTMTQAELDADMRAATKALWNAEVAWMTAKKKAASARVAETDAVKVAYEGMLIADQACDIATWRATARLRAEARTWREEADATDIVLARALLVANAEWDAAVAKEKAAAIVLARAVVVAKAGWEATDALRRQADAAD